MLQNKPCSVDVEDIHCLNTANAFQTTLMPRFGCRNKSQHSLSTKYNGSSMNVTNTRKYLYMQLITNSKKKKKITSALTETGFSEFVFYKSISIFHGIMR